MECNPDCVKVLDLDGTLLSMSKSGQKLLEIVDIGPYLNTSWIDFWQPEDRPRVREMVAAACSGGVGRFQAFCPSASGKPRWWEVDITPIPGPDGKPQRLLSISRDITECKRAEANQTLVTEILRMLNRGGDDLHFVIGEILSLIRESTGFDAVGLRMRKGDDCPYYEQNGFSEEFLQEENFLCEKRGDGSIVRDAEGRVILQCTCGLVLSGRTDPSMPCFTENGSFWTNVSSELLALTPEVDPRTNPRNRCIHIGYQSVGLFPVRSGEEIIGLLQLNGRQEGRFTPESIHFFESLANNIGLALKRKQMEESLRQKEADLRDAQRVAHVGSWYWDAKTDVTTGSDELLCIYGLDPTTQQMPTFSEQRGRCYPVEEWERVNAAVQTTMQTGVGYELDVQVIRYGTTIWVTTRGEVVRDADGRIVGLRGTVQDITERKREEAEREIAAGFLRLVNETQGKEDMVREAVTFFQEKSGCEAVGIRLKEGDDYPYYEARGFPQEFVRLENHLCARDSTGAVVRDNTGNPIIECMCGNVICGRFDPSKPFFTAHGSFWTNCTTELLASTTEADRQARTRNRCNGEGYESVALIPLRAGNERLGLLQVNDRRKGLFSAETIALWERLTGYLAVALAKSLAEEALRESEDRFRTMAESIPQLAWMAKPDGHIFWYNRRWYDYTGTTLEQMKGWGWQSVHDPVELPRVMERWKAAIAAGKPWEDTFPLRRHDGAMRWHLSRAMPICDPQGCVLQWFGTNTDITERTELEKTLQRAKAAAEAANEAKGRFLANMSHELRTPMNAILGMIDVALPKAADPIVQDCLQTAKGSADLLLTILNDLLDPAKIESGKLELESAHFSLRRMLDQITRVLSVRASEKGLSFCSRMPDDTPDVVIGDRMRLQQILLNLAGNAVKFTERGEVEISLHALSQNDEACLEFAVQDTGIGIPPFSLEHLFQPFAQVDASMARRFGGTGLGLSICKSLVEMMGGKIWVESQIDKGSTFYFTVRLPLAKELPADFESPVVIPTSASAQLRILLVEDNPANQKLATYILQDRGHVVEVAGDGQEAIYLSQNNDYDIILMDIQMPGINGLEATATIRKRENGGSRVPIIAMTAHAMREDRDRCLAAGMDGYLPKPVNAQEMISLVETLACGAGPVPQIASAIASPAEISAQSAAVVFNPGESLARCFNSQDMMREMIQCFFDDVKNLFPQMRTALEKGNLMEIGRLGHRLKGTIVYLGAEPAKEAALRVERFERFGGPQNEAEEAIRVLEQECLALKSALAGHPLTAETKLEDSH